MTDSSNSNDVFPPWSLSRIQSTLHFILFTQQSFSEPCHMPSTSGSGSAVDRTDLLLPLLLGRVHVRELASSVISLLVPSLHCAPNTGGTLVCPRNACHFEICVPCISCAYMSIHPYSLPPSVCLACDSENSD